MLKLRQHAKFRADQSNRCQDMAIFRFFQDGGRPPFWICYARVRTLNHNRFTSLFRGHSVEPVPEENFWTSWCKGRLTEADTPTIWLGATPSRLTSAHLHHPPIFL